MTIPPKYRGGATFMHESVDTYFEYIKFESFKKTFDKDTFLKQNPEYSHLFEVVEKVQAAPLDKITTNQDTLDLVKNTRPLPYCSLAYFLLNNPEIPICNSPLHHYSSKDGIFSAYTSNMAKSTN